MGHALGIILVVAFCTLPVRVLPFLVFGRKKEMPPSVRYLGNVLPPEIMAILIVYCFQDITVTAGSGWLPKILAAAVVIVLHLWKNPPDQHRRRTICYMVLLQTIF